MRRTAVVAIPAVLGLGLVVGLGVGAARAECTMPVPAMSAEAVALPPNPVIYRFEPSHRPASYLRIEGPDGTPIEYTASHRGPSSTIRAREIHVKATSGTFTVRGEDFEPVRTYTIGGFEKPSAPPVAESVSWIDDAWACSYSLGFVVAARGPDVVAFRVDFGPAYADWVLPPNDGYFWTREMGGEIDPAALRAFLGHPSCVENLIPGVLIGNKNLRLFAKYGDGSELEVELPRAWPPQPPPQPPQPPPRRPAYAYREPRVLDPWRVAIATAVSIAALISVSTLLVARRRRRYGTMVP